MRNIKLSAVLLFVCFAWVAFFAGNDLVQTVSSFSGGPPGGYTGAPGEQTCTACHAQNSGPGLFAISAPGTYVPGQTYQLQVNHATTDPSRLRWGFELTALDGTNSAAGTFANTSNFTQWIGENGRFYIEHTFEGTFGGQTGGAQWTFNWIAPSEDVGTVVFYAAGNQANNNGSSSGDQIYTATASANPGGGPTPTPTPTPTTTPSPFPELDLTISQSDSPDPVLTGHPLTYTLIVSNIPSVLGGSACPIVRFNYPSGVPFMFRSASGTNGFVGTPDANGVTFSEGCLSSINGTVTATLTIVLTPQAAGTLTSLGSSVVVDPGNLVPESNENNNTAQTVATTVINAPTLFDFDGDHKTDISIFRPSVGEWYYQRSSNGGVYGAQFGSSTDKPVPGDFTGDGRADIAFWRPSTGEWFVLRSEDSTYYAFPFGSTNDIPRPADYDGDGKADAAVYRPSISTWFILRSSDGGVTSVPFGISSDVPVPADYDGDGKADVAIWRSGPGEWWVYRSSNQTVFAAQFGSSTDKPVPGDYTGDGKADVAFYRPSEGSWYVIRSEDSSYYAFPFGNSTDKPVPADYDGDGRFDAAVFRPSDTNWYILKSTGGVQIQPFGLANDIPLPGANVP